MHQTEADGPQLSPRDSMARPEISIVVPLYNEEENVPLLIDRIFSVMSDQAETFEVILVDDGSTDSTVQRIEQASKARAELIGVYLARNYGQSTAMQAGFDTARGSIIVTLDGDLQNDPDDIPMLIQSLRDTGADLVSGWRVARKDGRMRKLFSRVANRVIAKATKVQLSDYGCSLKAYRTSILQRTRVFGEMHRFLPALINEVGGQVVEVPVRHHPRTRGTSKYGFDRTIRVALDILLIVFIRKYLQRPLHLLGGAGIVVGLIGFLVLLYLCVLKLLTGAPIGERPLLQIGVMLTLMGVVLIGQGLVSELVCRIYFGRGGQEQYFIRERSDQGNS